MSESVKTYCVLCGKETELFLTVDFDVETIPVCQEHIKTMRNALISEYADEKLFRQFIKLWKQENN